MNCDPQMRGRVGLYMKLDGDEKSHSVLKFFSFVTRLF